MGYGVGGGLADGVQMAGQFLMPAMQMRQQQKQFDAGMEQRKAEMGQHAKLFHDRLSLEQGWKDGMYGTSSIEEDGHPQSSLPPDAFPRLPANPVAPQQPSSLPPDAFPRTPQAPVQTPAQALAPKVMSPAASRGPQFIPSIADIRPKFSMQGLRPRRY